MTNRPLQLRKTQSMPQTGQLPGWWSILGPISNVRSQAGHCTVRSVLTLNQWVAWGITAPRLPRGTPETADGKVVGHQARSNSNPRFSKGWLFLREASSPPFDGVLPSTHAGRQKILPRELHMPHHTPAVGSSPRDSGCGSAAFPLAVPDGAESANRLETRRRIRQVSESRHVESPAHLLFEQEASVNPSVFPRVLFSQPRGPTATTPCSHRGNGGSTPSGATQTSQVEIACFRPASGSRVGMNSWPTNPAYFNAASFFMIAG